MSITLPDPHTAESPFLPGTTLQYAWDSVSLTAAMSCWRRYYYDIILGLRPRNPQQAIALDFGICFHTCMEHYETHRANGASPDEALRATLLSLPSDAEFLSLPTDDDIEAEAAAVAADPDDDDGIHLRNSKVRTRYHLLRAVVWYVEHYANDPCQTIILPSGKPAVELSFRIPIDAEVGGTDAILCGHIDRAVTFQDTPFVLDYKSTKSLSSQFFANFELSHQLSGYILAGQAILPEPAQGAIIDGIALLVGGAKFARRETKRSPSQLHEYIETVQNTLDEAERHADAGTYPMNTSACYFCDKKRICSADARYRKGIIRQHYVAERPWNPLDNR